MKIFNTYISKPRCLYYFLSGIIISIVCSCQPDEFVDEVSSSPNVIKFEYPALVNAVSMDKITKAEEKIVFQAEVTLDEPANKTFNASLLSEPQVAASQALANAAVIHTPDFVMPQSLEIRFGTRKVSFNVAVSISAIERNFGKNLVFAITLANPTKSQKIDENKKTVVFTINTTDVASINELHFLSFKSAVSDPNLVVTSLTSANLAANNASFDNNFLSIKPQVDLGGKPSTGFGTDIVYNQDTLKALAAKGLLPAGTVLLSEGAFTLPDVVLGDNSSSAIAEIGINLDSVFAIYPSKFAVAVTLSDPGKYQVDPAKSTLIYLIDPLRVFSNITKVLKNTSQPFRASSIEPNFSRFGVIADWISNVQANQHLSYNASNVLNGAYGTFDNTNNTQIVLESWAPSADAGKPGGQPTSPSITNGKIYQTISLPAGAYKFDVNVRSGTGVATDNAKGAYSIAAIGSTIPNIGAPTTPANFLGRAVLNNGGTKSFTFTLNAPATVSLGFVATLSGSQNVNISSVTLTRTLNP